MKKRMLSFLLALCMIVGMLPMVVLAEDTETPALTANVTVASGNNDAPSTWSPKMAEGMTTVYAKTVDGLIVTAGASDQDYNLKAEWPVGGKPTLTLKDATINNDNVYPNKQDTITTSGSADFDIVLQGTNVLNCYPSYTHFQNSAYRCPFGISATNTGMLTIRGANKATDKLEIHSWGGNGVARYYGPTTIENADFNIQVYKDATASSYSAHGITLLCGKSGAYTDKMDMVVRNSNFTINMHKNPGAKIIIVGVGDDAASSTNTSDILFQNSVIYFNRNNSSGQGTAAFAHGANTTVTFDRCVRNYLYAWRVMFTYMPTILNYTTATYTEEISSSSSKTYDYDPELAGTSIKVRTVTWTHECLAGEPFIEKHAAECTTKQYEVTNCVVCGKETSRVEQEITEPGKIHTPGAKVELDQDPDTDGFQRTNGGLVYTSDAKTHYKIQSGKYVFQHTCSVCGETWTTEEAFQPAILYYITKGAGNTNNNANANTNTKVGYKSSNVRVYNPGTTIYYKTVVGTDANNPNNAYMIYTTNADDIAAGNWNVKFEYPVGGTPVLTFNNATIKNNEGLWYGYAGWRNVAPLTIVLKGTNYIEQTKDIQGSGPLMFLTSNGVTITGDGSLNLVTYNAGHALYALSDLTLDNVDISITRPQSHATSTRGYAIGSTADITINGGSLDVTSFSSIDVGTDKNGNPTYATYSGFYSAVGGANVTIKNANITAQGAFHANYGILYSTGNIAISESSLLLAQGFVNEEHVAIFNTNAITCKGTLTWDYKNGMVGKTIHTDDNSFTVFDSAVEPNITYPAGISDIVEGEDMDKAAGRNYLMLEPAKKLEKFEGTRVGLENNLILEFALDSTNIPEGSIAYITRTDGEDVDSRQIVLTAEMVGEDGFYAIPYAGISAKEIHDQITVVVKSADGTTVLSETETDSVYDYAVRMLRKPENAEDKELLNVLVAMLNYGTMAQVQFEHNTGNLANKVLTPAEWGYATETFVKPEATPATVEKEEGVETSIHRGTTFELKSNIAMLIAVSNEDIGKGSYAKVYKDGEYVETVNATDRTTYAMYTFTGMVAADGSKNITFKIYDSNDVLKMTVTDSLEAYVGRNIDKYPYLENLMKYCNAAAAYFAS